MITERLKMVMEHYKLTSAALADGIGVPRSSISHLLSGRNKPSLDFILKLIKSYPEVNLYWLLNGKGEFPDLKTTQKAPTLPDLPIENVEHPNTSEPTKRVTKVMLFYNDGSFEEFKPKK